MKRSLLVSFFMLASAGAAYAGGQPGSIGLGGEFQLTGLGGPSINYDAGKFHVGGFFGYFDPAGADNTLFEFGGRFYWHVHSTAMSDFGVGGDIGIASVPPGGPGGNRTTDVFLEPGFQIRVFIASNVALSFTGGLTIGIADASGVALTAQGISSGAFGTTGLGLNGGAGVHYYFF